ncbi:MAG: VOC family protein [Saprospiraceae bacterium]|nr:VOC family protein [Saprospiraceae bacterium]
MDRFYTVMDIAPEYGGIHTGKGTHNALIRLADQTYLELIAPDPAQQVHKRWMISGFSGTEGLIRWCWRTNRITEQILTCRGKGWVLGDLMDGNRTRADGSVLSWKLTDPDCIRTHFEPFLIEWSAGIHPCDSLEEQSSIIQIVVSEPDPKQMSYLNFLPKETCLKVEKGSSGLSLILETSKGRFRLKNGDMDLSSY